MPKASKNPVVMTDAEREAKWRAEDDARTLECAAMISQDPERLKRANTVITEKVNALSSVARSTSRILNKKSETSSKSKAQKPASKGKKK
jgi:hypothetical protein